MFFAILFSIIALAVGSILFIALFKPVEEIINATQGLWNSTAEGTQAMTMLHNAWIWFPIILFLVVALYLLVKTMEEKKYGVVYPAEY